MCWCSSYTQADETTTLKTTNSGNYGWSVSLSNVVFMSASTSAAVKRCLEFEPGLVFQLVETKV